MPRRHAVRFAFACAIASLTALSASPALADPGAGNSSLWKLGYYTPSNQTLSFATVPQGAPALATFEFTAANNTALLVTDHGSLKGTDLGNLTNKTITATFHISGAGAFTYYGEPDACGTPANVRLFFQTDNGGGFAYTHYWWSNPEAKVLSDGTFDLKAKVSGSQWSDWNGQSGITEGAGFADAAANVTMIGFSFGGGCFFENGVGSSNGTGTFQLNTFTVAS